VFTAGIRVGVAGESLASFDLGVARASAAVAYVSWGTPLSWLARLIHRDAWRGAQPIFELYPGPGAWNASQVAYGSGDSWLRSLSHAIAADGRHVVLSFFPEMNGPWRASWSSGPASYIRAYRHVNNVVGAIAGSLVTWSWQPSAMHNANPDPMPWWPGAGYVNMISLDGYYYFPHDNFSTIFAATIRLVRRTAPNLPLMVGETAAGPMYGRQTWEINDLFAGVRRYGLLGFVWFDHAQHSAPFNFHQDWHLEDHAAALAAFRAGLARYGPVARYQR
jgi:hypothetical protein